MRMAIEASGLPLKVIFNKKRSTLQGKMTRSKLYPDDCADREEEGREKRRGRPRKACVSCGSVTDAAEKAGICRMKNVLYSISCGYSGEKYLGGEKTSSDGI